MSRSVSSRLSAARALATTSSSFHCCKVNHSAASVPHQCISGIPRAAGLCFSRLEVSLPFRAVEESDENATLTPPWLHEKGVGAVCGIVAGCGGSESANARSQSASAAYSRVF